MDLANNVVGALLAFLRQVAVCEVVLGEALMTGNPGTVENGKRAARESTHVNLAGDQAGGDADRIVVGELHVRQPHIPIGLAFVDDHSPAFGAFCG